MFRPVKNYIKEVLKKSGWVVVHDKVWNDLLYSLPKDYDPAHTDTYNKVRDYTMTTSERIVAICSSIDYLTKNNIGGDIVECGVWKGGSTMASIDTLIKNKSTERGVYLYDTFEGMPAPGKFDKKTGGQNSVGQSAKEIYENAAADDYIRAYSSLDEVKHNIESLNYPAGKVHYVKGLVENTIPANIPKKIALLRLNVDFYEPTLHALNHLYPLLAPGGVVNIDDYGDWAGARRAIEEYIEVNKIPLLLNRVDSTGRIGIKYK